jgi:hypothetical protein
MWLVYFEVQAGLESSSVISIVGLRVEFGECLLISTPWLANDVPNVDVQSNQSSS